MPATPRSSRALARRDPAPVGEPLFRQEALDAQQGQWLGTVLLAPRISHGLLTLFGIATAAAIVALLLLADFTRKERISGWLVPEKGLARVLVPQTGVITELHVRDGDHVAMGMPLVTVSTEVQSQALGATEGEIVQRLASRRDSLRAERLLQRRLQDEEAASLTRRLEALRLEQRQLESEIAIQQDRLQLALDVAQRLRPLHQRQLITVQRLEEAEQNRLDQTQQHSTLERQLTAISRALAEVESERISLPLRTQALLAELDRDVAFVEQELASAEARRQFVITAGLEGTVTALRAEVGSSVDTRVPLLSIVPQGSALTAELFVPSRAIGFIRKGQPVLLRYRAFPYQKFGHHEGTVEAISRSSLSPNELGAHVTGLTSLLRGDEPVYLVVVRLARQTITAYGEPVPLQPGMQLDADILIETRRLIEWVFDPLYTLTGRLQG